MNRALWVCLEIRSKDRLVLPSFQLLHNRIGWKLLLWNSLIKRFGQNLRFYSVTYRLHNHMAFNYLIFFTHVHCSCILNIVIWRRCFSGNHWLSNTEEFHCGGLMVLFHLLSVPQANENSCQEIPTVPSRLLKCGEWCWEFHGHFVHQWMEMWLCKSAKVCP